ncbi:MAG: hypothetical protein WCG93_08780 [Paludibacter sp.]
MKKKELNETWQEHKVNLKKQIATLTDNNIRSAINQKSNIFDKLQASLGVPKEDLDKFFLDA